MVRRSSGNGSSFISKIPTFPTKTRGLFTLNPFALWLPATVTSLLSLTVLAWALALVLIPSAQRFLFRLPLPPVVFVLPATLLALLVLLRTADRPGPLFPRLWALGLVAVCVVSLPLGPIWSGLQALPLRALPHAAAIGCLGAALMMLVRLLRIPPSSHLLYRLGPVVCVSLLIMTSYGVGHAYRLAVTGSAERLDAKLAAMNQLREQLADHLDYTWTEFADNETEAASRTSALRELADSQTVGAIFPSAEEWRMARLLNLDERLTKNYSELLAMSYLQLIDVSASAWTDNDFPRLAQLRVSAINNKGRGQWERSASFEGLSASVARYHQANWQLLRALGSRTAGGTSSDPTAEQARAAYQARREDVRQTLSALSRTYSDHWTVYALPDLTGVVTQSTVPLRDLFTMPLVDGEGYKAGDLRTLFALDIVQARDLATADKGCLRWNVARRRDDYFRLDCMAYDADPREAGALPRLQTRVVWNEDRESGPPDGVYYTAFVPPGGDPKEFLERFMKDLYQVFKDLDLGSLTFPRSSTNPARGFSLEMDGNRYDILPPDHSAPRKKKIHRGQLEARGGLEKQVTIELWIPNQVRKARNGQ